MSNIDAIAGYRASTDAAAAVGLCQVLEEGREEISPEAWQEVRPLLAEICEVHGTDPRPHARRAARIMNALVADNEALVKKVARRTLGSRAKIPANLEEAVQEGSMGLVKAIEGFDLSKGKFSTWAAFQIRDFVQRAMTKQTDFAKQRSACMPPKVAKAVNKFRLLQGREPAPEEITYEVGGDGDAPPVSKTVTPEEWARWLDATYVEPLDGPSGGDEPSGRAGRNNEIADEKQTPEQQIASLDLREKLAAELAEMSPRNREITRAIFIEGRSYAEVGESCGLSTHRIQQLKGVLEKRLREVLAA